MFFKLICFFFHTQITIYYFENSGLQCEVNELRRINIFFIFTSCFILLLIPVLTSAQDSDANQVRVDDHGNLRLENEYIAIVVNQHTNSMGRFAVETTGGAPLKDQDENKPLIYGRPQPWPSYTTFRIDGEDYVFGGQTERRAGRDGIYGEVVTAPRVVDNQRIITTTDFEGIIVDQILSFEKGITTGLKDSVRIEYKIENETKRSVDIGSRIMLDTMLGENDGAPFRVGEDVVDTDRMIIGNDLPQYWQAFDSIASPSVVSQGTFRKPDLKLPDEVYFSNWGSLADGVWEFDFEPGQEFWRAGEFEIDSAMAMYWYPEELGPGEQRVYSTEYGLGGVEVVPGLISIADSSPAEVTFDRQDRTFPIIIYIENDSDIVLKNMNVELELPDSYFAENLNRSLGDFEPGEVSQVVWDVGAAIDIEKLTASMEFKVTADADNTDANELERKIRIIGPPEPQKDIKIENITADYGTLSPNPFAITADVKNIGGSSLYNTRINVDLPPGLRFEQMEKQNKYIGELKPQEIVSINWNIEILSGLSGTDIPVSINLSGYNQHFVENTIEFDIPRTDPLIYLEKPTVPESLEKYQVIEVNMQNLNNIYRVLLDLNYNPENMKLVNILPGTIFASEGRLVLWEKPEINNNGNINFEQILPQNVNNIKNDSFASLVFKVFDSEKTNIEFGNCLFEDQNGNAVEVNKLGVQ